MSENKRKKEGQFMTPTWVVNMILDSVGYAGAHILQKRIMEPSFGDGQFLLEIAKRIIIEGRNQKLTDKKLAGILAGNVCGIEKDVNLYNQAIKRLNVLVKEENLPEVGWKNLKNADTLLVYENYMAQFDYVVGNPPFVRIHNIANEYQKIIKDFKFADGIYDLYVLFYEIGVYMLNNEGRLGYITPNAFMRNASQVKFRDFLIRNKYLSAIYNFKESKIFKDADTYTCICLLDMDSKRKNSNIYYKEYKLNELAKESVFKYSYFKKDLAGKAWSLSSNDDVDFLKSNSELSTKVKTKAVVQNGIVTNRDNLYIGKAFISDKEDKDLIPYMGKHTEEKKIVYFKTKNSFVPIESTILHRCVKASRFDGIIDNSYILFPYKYKELINVKSKEGETVKYGYMPYTENEMKEYFPLAYDYLCENREELSKRDMDKNVDWFLFGRSQGLQNSFLKKVIFKSIIDPKNERIVPYIIDEDVIVYSKLYSTVELEECMVYYEEKKLFNKSEYDKRLKEICDIYASHDFWRYCVLSGKNMSGGYVDVSSASIVKNFGVKQI